MPTSLASIIIFCVSPEHSIVRLVQQAAMSDRRFIKTDPSYRFWLLERKVACSEIFERRRDALKEQNRLQSKAAPIDLGHGLHKHQDAPQAPQLEW